MKYSKFINEENEVSRLGFGLMRLPVIENDHSLIDYKKSTELIELAIANGITYFDTAYVYHNKQSEIFTGQALKNFREKVKIATKIPVWKIEKEEDFDYLLDIELQKLQTDYVDFLLLHALDRERFENIKQLNIYESGLKVKTQGKIKYLGFSFHDDLSLFKEIIDTYDFDFCQIQLNILDENYQAGIEGMKYAKEKGLGLVVMEPLKGGQLVNLPKSITDKLDGYSPANLSFSYLLDKSEIDVILSGMNSVEQLLENCKIFDDVTPNSLDNKVKEKINFLKDEIHSRLKVDCTRCSYCMPCPAGVAIPEVFKIYNNKYIFENTATASSEYSKLIEDKKDQSSCIECGQCEEKCPQHLNIIEDLKNADADLRGGNNE